MRDFKSDVTTLKIGPSVLCDPLTYFSALTLFHKILPGVDFTTLSPAAVLALFSVCIFFAFKAACFMQKGSAGHHAHLYRFLL